MEVVFLDFLSSQSTLHLILTVKNTFFFSYTLISEDSSEVLLMMKWDEKASLRDDTCEAADVLFLICFTCKKGTLRLWSGEHLSDGQVNGGSQ